MDIEVIEKGEIKVLAMNRRFSMLQMPRAMGKGYGRLVEVAQSLSIQLDNPLMHCIRI